MKNKRGSQVEMVLSFMIFIVFLIFVYAGLQPAAKIDKEKQTTLNNLKRGFLEEISGNVVIINIKNSTTGEVDCLKISESETGISGLNSIVKNSEGDIVNSTSSGGVLRIKTPEGGFFRIFSSEEEFEEYSANTTSCVGAEIKSVREGKYIFKAKIGSLKEDYDNDYNEIKRGLGVPAVDDFGFNFEESDGNIIGTKEERISGNIYSERIPVHYINGNANINEGFINIKVW